MAKKTSRRTSEKKSTSPAYDCYCTFHPGAVLSGGFQFERRIEDDFRRFRAPALKAPSTRPPTLGAGGMVGFDTEYDPHGVLLTIGVASARSAIAVEGDFKAAKKIIRKAKGITAHSVTGDLDHLVKLGLAKESWLRGIGIRDSFLLARMVDENRGKGGYGLEPLLLSEFNFTEWKSETAELLERTGNAADWTPAQRMQRCRVDAWATQVLADHFEGKLK